MAIKKKNFSEIKQKFSKKATYKVDKFFDLGEAFIDATGLPGPAMGHINMMLGHSDTGKTTALVKTAVDGEFVIATNLVTPPSGAVKEITSPAVTVSPE